MKKVRWTLREMRDAGVVLGRSVILGRWNFTFGEPKLDAQNS
jgi:hypothetical protein